MVWVILLLACWKFCVPAWAIVPIAILSGWSLKLYRMIDLQLVWHMIQIDEK
jgi:hypothetical protein